MIEEDFWLELSKLRSRVDALYTQDLPFYNYQWVGYRSTSFIHNSSGNWLAIPFDVDSHDPQNMHDIITNNSRVYAWVSGMYAFSISIQWDSASAGTKRIISVRKNGTVNLAISGVAPTTNYPYHCMSGLAKLAGSDYVEYLLWQDSGSSITIPVIMEYSLWAKLVRIA